MSTATAMLALDIVVGIARRRGAVRLELVLHRDLGHRGLRGFGNHQLLEFGH